MATVRYWNADYWNANYWQATYWAASTAAGTYTGQIAATTTLAGPGVTTGAYWNSNYWNDFYWNSDYWKEVSPGGGTTFFGTFTPAGGNTGTITVTLGDDASGFVGTVGQTDIFDIDVSFSVLWTMSEFSTYTGSIAVTAEDVSAAFSGLFSENFTGSIATTLDDSTSNFDGTHVAPPNRSGTIATTLQDDSSLFQGLYVDGTLGTIAVTLQPATAAFTGQYITSNTDGSIGVTLEDVTANWDGAVFASGDVVGSMNISLDNVSPTFTGTFEPNVPDHPIKRENRQAVTRKRRRTVL